MKKVIVFLMVLTLISCAEQKKKKQIRLGDYDKPLVENTTTENNISATATSVNGTEKAVETPAEVVEITLKATDQMTFDKKEITVPAGATVKLTLTHTGTLAVKVMGHNFVLLQKGTDIPSFAIKAMNFPDNAYVPKGSPKVIAHTKLVGGGNSTTIEFKAPSVGTYPFICSFPGHYTNMKGLFIVK